MEKEKYPEGYVKVKSICPNWVTDNFLDFMDLKLEDLKDKNITSIGGGFGIFEMDAAKEGAKVTVVDPVFSNKSGIDGKIQENVDWLNDKMGKNHHTIVNEFRNNIMKALSECKDDVERLELEDRLSWCGERQLEIEEYLRRRKILVNHLKAWKENQTKYGLILNTSSGNHIEGIDSDSQDIVIIAHTLGHIFNRSSLDILEFFSEALKLLKPEGKLYIIDYVGDILEIDKVLEKTDCKMYYKVNKGSFVCCFDKNGLSKFLEKEGR